MKTVYSSALSFCLSIVCPLLSCECLIPVFHLCTCFCVCCCEQVAVYVEIWLLGGGEGGLLSAMEGGNGGDDCRHHCDMHLEFTVLALQCGWREALRLGLLSLTKQMFSAGKMGFSAPVSKLADGILKLFAPLMLHLHFHIVATRLTAACLPRGNNSRCKLSYPWA